jgi:hypothetical protein
MEHVLYAVDYRRALGTFGNIDETLEANEVAANVLGQYLEQQGQGHRPHRRCAHQR